MNPKASARPPRYCLHKASGQARIVVAGKSIYLGPHGSPESWEAYNREVAKLVGGMNAAPTLARRQGSVSVMELAEAYLKHAETHYGVGGELYLIKCMLKAVRIPFGRERTDAFGPLSLQAVQRAMVAEGHTRQWINKITDRAKRLFKWGVTQEMVPVTVFEALRCVPGLRRGKTTAPDTKPVQPVPDAVVDATIPHLGAVVSKMVRLQRLTGMRPGELCIMRPADVDRSADIWLYTPREHKTAWRGQRRVVPIGPKAQEELAPFLARPADSFCFSPAESERTRKDELRARRKTKVQPSQFDRRKTNAKRRPRKQYSVLAYRNAIYRGCNRAFPHPELSAIRPSQRTPDQKKELGAWQAEHHWHPHQLRHTAATEIRREFGLEAAQVVLGHTRANTTEIYAEANIKKAVDAARRIG